jgi:hypothetical protein
MRIHATVPGQPVYGCHAKAESEFKMRTYQLREKTLTEEHRYCRNAEDWRKVDSPTQKMICHEIPRKKARDNTGLSRQ